MDKRERLMEETKRFGDIVEKKGSIEGKREVLKEIDKIISECEDCSIINEIAEYLHLKRKSINKDEEGLAKEILDLILEALKNE